MELLIARGAEVNARDTESGATALHYAASWGRREAVELLLEKGAEVNARSKAGVSPLGAALQNGHAETAEVLRSQGAKE
jgi:ankyrin repeat protein